MKARHLLTLCACAWAARAGATPTPTPLDPKAAESLRGQTVAYVVHPPAHLQSLTPGGAAFGLLGALAESGAGKAAEQNGLHDPAPELAQALSKALAAAYGAQPAQQPVSADTVSTSELSAMAGQARYLLDVRTQWSTRYFATDWSHYNVIYNARARLIDVAARSVLADLECSRESGKDGAPTQDELMANQAARLKREMAIGANTCLQTMRTGMLRLPPNDDTAVAVADDRPSVDDPVPFLTPKGQERFRQFLKKPVPRAFAISDNGFSVSVSGTHPENPAYPTDPQQRALQMCQEYAGRACRLYMVDERIVYHR
ncbi:hypothetical protein LJR289_000371 [Pseudoduganella sp. LjRoot289]|uniref:hypothetical protein n=1 Tax=Pseudoduganella sp. LjRoot289 TaxID=3342314 RepID=UPI003ECEDA71